MAHAAETQRALGPPAPNGGLSRFFSSKAQAIRLIYKQLLLVWLSFSAMAILSYFFIGNTMQAHLRESADITLTRMEAAIASKLAESTVMLKGVSQSVRYMIMRGANVRFVHDYIKHIPAIDTSRKMGLNGVYGWFDTFGAYLNDGAWTPAADYVPQQRPWYLAAVVAQGEVAATPPYLDARGRGVVMSFARRIFDDDARPLAVVSTDVSLDALGAEVVATRLTENGYGVLLSAHLQVIAHKDASGIGKTLSYVNSKIADYLQRGDAIVAREGTDYQGNEAVFFFRQIANGWYLGLVTPIGEYYQDARRMAQFLFTLGVLLATALSMVLLHIAESKERADARLRTMFEASPLCATFWDRTPRAVDCNREALSLLGASSKQELGEKFFECWPEYQPCGSPSVAKALEWFDKVFEEGYCRFEWMHQTMQKEPIPTEVTLVRMRYQHEFIVCAYIRDLRELKATMRQIADESARFEAMAHRYHAILDAIPLPISVTDADTQWTFINAAVEKFLGVKRDDVLGQPCSNWGAHICNTTDCGIACVKRGVKQTYFVHEGASYKVDVETLKDLHGNTMGFVEIVQDVTQLEEMAKRQTEAEAVSKAKSAFLAVVSHEIRTPMNAILGITEIQLQNDALSQDMRDAFGRIYTAGYTLLGIINDILDLSRMEAGKVELMPGKYELASLVNDTVQLNLVRIGGKPIEFKLQVAEDVPSALFGDELRIKQILNNLLSNAFKYTQAGEVVLSVSAVYGEGKESPDVTLVCRVSDTGHGMTVEQVSRLFEEYSRFYLEANRTIEGIGLGMSITRQLVHMMGGDIFVESEPDRGSAFTVWLPQDSVGAEPLGREMVESLQQFKASMPFMKVANIVREPMPYGSVLVVDDLETNLYVTKGLLAPYGLAVDTVLSGFEAIDRIRSGSEYDVVLMDHMMPKMDGVETTKILRDLGYAHPIIALTANAVSGQAEMFLASGFNGFISKPADLRQLNSMLNRLVRDKQPPEVVEAARRQKGGPVIVNRDHHPAVDPQLAAIFARDAEKTVAVLEAMHTKQYRRDDDMHTFVVNVHAMKSALANIGEAELAASAHKLEQAGRNKAIDVMSIDTPAFLEALRAAIERIRPVETGVGDEETAEDRAQVREKLSVIQAACAAYDKKAAKDALAELRRLSLSRQTREQLDAIAEYLLHSDFEEAANFADQTIRTL